MNSTQLVAWIGAVTGVAGLGWNIYLRLSSGPKLRVLASANNVKMPPPPGNPHFLSITVTNRGTAPTTITNLSFCSYDSWWKQKPRALCKQRHGPMLRPCLIAEYEGDSLPRKLDVGGEMRALMKQDGDFDKRLDSDILWVNVWHSFSRRPASVKILRPSV